MRLDLSYCVVQDAFRKIVYLNPQYVLFCARLYIKHGEPDELQMFAQVNPDG